jgi:hypothetical protein
VKKKIGIIALGLTIATVSIGCTRSGAQEVPPLQDTAGALLPTILTPVEDGSGSNAGQATDTPIVFVATTTTPEPTGTQSATREATASPTIDLTQTPTFRITPEGTPLNPEIQWGPPDFIDEMDSASQVNWAQSDGSLPNTSNIELQLNNDQMWVTGKILGWETWWLSWPQITNAYLEATLHTGTCEGRDAYGLIFRAPPSGVRPTTGYIVLFSCDGQYTIRRLDSDNPYSTTELEGWIRSPLINSGSDQTNIMGIKFEGSTITVYANDFLLTEINETSFSEGRYGVFVIAAETENFTYRLEELAYWLLP